MGDQTSISNERISALMDGELHADECAHVLDGLLSDPQSMSTWHAYQVLGDLLRSPELAPTRDDFAFLEKLEQRLSQEPQRLTAVISSGRLDKENYVAVETMDGHKRAANASVFSWKALAGVALVAVVGSGYWTQISLRSGVELASVPLLPSVAPTRLAMETSTGPMLRDARLDELMAAHRQLGGHSALQVPTGFLRNATYEGAGR